MRINVDLDECRSHEQCIVLTESGEQFVRIELPPVSVLSRQNDVWWDRRAQEGQATLALALPGVERSQGNWRLRGILLFRMCEFRF